jgi:hypothetical protein
MLRSLWLLPLLALTACVTPTSRSNIVVLTDNAGVVEGCASLGPIDGSPPLKEILLRDQAREGAIARLKAGAAERGGTHVKTSVADIKWKGPDTSGIVYRCGKR